MNSCWSKFVRLGLLLLGFGVWPGVAPAASPLQITNRTNSPAGFRFDWTSQGSGSNYTVQYRDSLTNGPWLMPAEQLWPIALPQWLDAHSAGRRTSRFYRVVAVLTAQRGLLQSATLATTMTAAQINLLFASAGLPATAQYSVRFYKVVYETITPLGAQTKASGALLLPVSTGKPLPLVSYQHGTITQTNKAPSSMDIYGEVSVGLLFAATGYAAALPDYLGLGDSPGLHPYHHARSEASASIDLLRAVKTLCATNGFLLTNRLFLCGYSQGGHSTMALLRELETFHTNEFAVTACAPMAGAYDLSGVTTTNFLSGRAQPNPYYFAYLLAAYQDVYHFAATLADLLTSPYNTTLPPLLRGNSTGGQINAAMPSDPLLVLKPEVLAAFRANSNHPLRVALRDNDPYQWTPRSPLRLYHCAADQDVIIANSQVAYASFQSRGATQVLINDPLPSGDHSACVQPSLTLAKTWFDSLR